MFRINTALSRRSGILSFFLFFSFLRGASSKNGKEQVEGVARIHPEAGEGGGLSPAKTSVRLMLIVFDSSAS